MGALGSVAATLVVLAVLGHGMVVGRGILLPFVCALFVWTLLTGLTDAIGRLKNLQRVLPYGVRLLLAVVALGLALWFLGDIVARNLRLVSAAAPGYQANLEPAIASILEPLGLTRIPVAEVLRPIDLPGTLTSILGGITTVAGSAGAVLLYVLFLLLEGPTFPRKVRLLVQSRDRELALQDTLRRIAEQIRMYLALKTLTSSLVAILSFVVLRAVGVDFAGFWGVLTFVLNFVPYIGSFFAVLFPSALSLLQFQSVPTLVLTVALLLSSQFLVGSILEPRWMGRSLNLSPVVILLSLATWGAIWGVVGMFLAIPLMVALMIVLAEFDRTRPMAILMSEQGEVGRSPQLLSGNEPESNGPKTRSRR